MNGGVDGKDDAEDGQAERDELDVPGAEEHDARRRQQVDAPGPPSLNLLLQSVVSVSRSRRQ